MKKPHTAAPEQSAVKDLNILLSEGADERIFLDDEGLTRYGTPLVNNDVVNRGSCTGNPARAEDVTLLQQLLRENIEVQDWKRLIESNRQTLQGLMNPPEASAFEVFFSPSGTDLVFLPLMFHRLLEPKRPVLNIITCLEELGSGTRLAAQGQFYANYNQFGEWVPKGSRLVEGTVPKTVFFNARSASGAILDHQQSIRELVRTHAEHFIVINLVYGSKSGIEENLSLIDQVQADNVLFTVDLCQFRHRRSLINTLLAKGALLMITGSKFYQAPPFCGAFLVPEALTSRLRKAQDWSSVKGFGSVFSRYDMPPALQNLAPFPATINQAGALRWAVALAEINRYQSLSKRLVREKIECWSKCMLKEIESRPCFELMPDQNLTNSSIISFRLRYEDRYLDHDELKALYFSIVKDDYASAHDFRRVNIGQPVRYGDRSFLRIAVGAKNIRHFVQQDEQSFTRDRMILSIIEEKLYATYANLSQPSSVDLPASD